MDGAVKRRKAAKVPELVVAPGTFEDYAVAIGLPTLHGAVEHVRAIRGERAAAARARGERGIVARRDADALAVVIGAAEIVLRMTAGAANGGRK
jgi:hypothetical protein